APRSRLHRSIIIFIWRCSVTASNCAQSGSTGRRSSHVWITLCVSGAIAASGIGAAWAGEAAVKLGGKVPPFERKDSTGRTFKLAETIRTVKAIVLTEWSSRCPVSKKFDPYLNEVAASYAAKGAKLIGIDSNYNEPADEVEKVRKERGLVFPVLMDGEGGQ